MNCGFKIYLQSTPYLLLVGGCSWGTRLLLVNGYIVTAYLYTFLFLCVAVLAGMAHHLFRSHFTNEAEKT